MQNTDSKAIRQFCSVCKSDFEMDVVKQGSSENVLWLKCPGCRGYLPYMPGEFDESEEIGAIEEQPVAVEDLDVDGALEYSEEDVFEVGQVIHHRSWNDYGKIIGKDKLPGNRRTIWVQFLRQGKVQLLEGVTR